MAESGELRLPEASDVQWKPCGARVACGIVGVHALLLTYAAWLHSPCWPEFAHLPAGISHWRFGQFDLYRVNPPLPRMVAALPVLGYGPEVEWPPIIQDTRRRSEWECAPVFVRRSRGNLCWYVTLARWSCIPFSLLGAWVCFRWACALYGPMAGLIAVTAWCFDPAILGHAQVVSSDVAAAGFGAGAFYLYWRWLREPSWGRALRAGLLLGLAELTKFSWIILFGLWPLVWLVRRLVPRRSRAEVTLPRERRFSFREPGQLGTILTFAVLIINVGYGFEGSGQRLGDFRFVSRSLRLGDTDGLMGPYSGCGNRFAGTRWAILPVPLPANYVLGIDRQKYDFEEGFWSYLRGEWRYGGWWYYYLYALGIKEPIGTWMLVVLAAALGLFCKGYSGPWEDELILLVPIVAVLVLVSSQSGFSHHMRYVLPAFPFVFIWMSKVVRSIELGHRAIAVAVAGALTWSVGGSLYHYPHSLSYFNEAVGGPMQGHRHLLNSNIDWGQDLLFLKKWLEEHPESQTIGLAYSLPQWLFDPADIGITYTLPPPGLDGPVTHRPLPKGEVGPLPGWYAVFVGAMLDRDRRYSYFEHFEPIEMLGYTVRIYRISLDDANCVRRKLGVPQIGPAEVFQSGKVAESKS